MSVSVTIWCGWGGAFSSVAWYSGAQLATLSSFSSDFQLCRLEDQGSPSVTQYVVSVKSSSLLLHSFDVI